MFLTWATLGCIWRQIFFALQRARAVRMHAGSGDHPRGFKMVIDGPMLENWINVPQLDKIGINIEMLEF